MAPPTNRESDKFIVRLPDGMRDRIKAAAEANNRSMNAEIVARLDQSASQSIQEALPKALALRISVNASMNHRPFEAEVLDALMRCYPEPPANEQEKALAGLLAELKDSLDRLKRSEGEQSKTEDRIRSLESYLSTLRAAPPDVAKAVAYRVMTAAEKIISSKPPSDDTP